MSFFFFFLTENAWDVEWVQACNSVADITALGHVPSCLWDYLSNRIQLLPVGSLHQGTPDWNDDQGSFSSHINLIPSLWAQFPKENSCKKVLFIFLYQMRDIKKKILMCFSWASECYSWTFKKKNKKQDNSPWEILISLVLPYEDIHRLCPSIPIKTISHYGWSQEIWTVWPWASYLISLPQSYEQTENNSSHFQEGE